MYLKDHREAKQKNLHSCVSKISEKKGRKLLNRLIVVFLLLIYLKQKLQMDLKMLLLIKVKNNQIKLSTMCQTFITLI